MIVRQFYVDAQPSGLASKWTPKLITPVAPAIDSLPWRVIRATAPLEDEAAAKGSRWTPQLSFVKDQLPWLVRRRFTIDEDVLTRRSGWGPQLTAVVAPVVLDLAWRKVALPPVDEAEQLRRIAWGPQLTVAPIVLDLAWRKIAVPAVDDVEQLRQIRWQPWLTGTVVISADQLPWRYIIRGVVEDQAQSPQVSRWTPALTSASTPPPVFVRQPEVFGSARPGLLGGTSGTPGVFANPGTSGTPSTFTQATTIGSPGIFTPNV